MNNIVEEIKQIFIEQGLDPLSAKLLSILWLEPKEISVEELAKKANYSLSSLSLKLKHLEKNWSIKRIKHRDSRKTFLYMEKDLYNIAIDNLKRKYETESSLIQQKLKHILKNEEIPQEKREIIELYKQRQAQFKKLLPKVIELFESIKED